MTGGPFQLQIQPEDGWDCLLLVGLPGELLAKLHEDDKLSKVRTPPLAAYPIKAEGSSQGERPWLPGTSAVKPDRLLA